MSLLPHDHHRRSFVHSRLVAAGAGFADIGDAAVAVTYPQIETPALGLVDLSPLPRTGIKGPRACAWMKEQDWPLPDADNVAVASAGGSTVLRLGPRELVVLAAPGTPGDDVRALEVAIPGEGAWSVPRRDTNAWFQLRGEPAADCLAKLCGVDLRAHRFPPGTIAQTSVARLNAIVCRDPGAPVPAFHLLADSASALWFWDTLLDAMQEFDGAPLGLLECG